ncbi:MAG: hypothetical protein HAW67_00910, partial [Endozoicomonadaceae bacterium]|nr:hypothetical protein [Endozoicomonadaceae bacterium]
EFRNAAAIAAIHECEVEILLILIHHGAKIINHDVDYYAVTRCKDEDVEVMVNALLTEGHFFTRTEVSIIAPKVQIKTLGQLMENCKTTNEENIDEDDDIYCLEYLVAAKHHENLQFLINSEVQYQKLNGMDISMGGLFAEHIEFYHQFHQPTNVEIFGILQQSVPLKSCLTKYVIENFPDIFNKIKLNTNSEQQIVSLQFESNTIIPIRNDQPSLILKDYIISRELSKTLDNVTDSVAQRKKLINPLTEPNNAL